METSKSLDFVNLFVKMDESIGFHVRLTVENLHLGDLHLVKRQIGKW